jgi:hypothetical protein
MAMDVFPFKYIFLSSSPTRLVPDLAMSNTAKNGNCLLLASTWRAEYKIGLDHLWLRKAKLSFNNNYLRPVKFSDKCQYM